MSSVDEQIWFRRLQADGPVLLLALVAAFGVFVWSFRNYEPPPSRANVLQQSYDERVRALTARAEERPFDAFIWSDIGRSAGKRHPWPNALDEWIEKAPPRLIRDHAGDGLVAYYAAWGLRDAGHPHHATAAFNYAVARIDDFERDHPHALTFMHHHARGFALTELGDLERAVIDIRLMDRKLAEADIDDNLYFREIWIQARMYRLAEQPFAAARTLAVGMARAAALPPERSDLVPLKWAQVHAEFRQLPPPPPANQINASPQLAREQAETIELCAKTARLTDQLPANLVRASRRSALAWTLASVGADQQAAALWGLALTDAQTTFAEYVPLSVSHLYDLACFHALAGDRDSALDFWERAIAAGYNTDVHAARDRDLELIHDHPRFLAGLEEIRFQREINLHSVLIDGKRGL